MRQQNLEGGQLAQEVIDFLEPVILYLVIRSKRADKEAGKKVGVQAWEIRKKLWEEFSSIEYPDLKEAAADLAAAPSDPETKEILVRKLFAAFEKNPEFAQKILAFMKENRVRRILAEAAERGNLYLSSEKNPPDKERIIEEFNSLLEAFLEEKNSTRNLEQLEPEDEEKNFYEKLFLSKKDPNLERKGINYTHIQLNQGIIEEKSSPISIRMAKIVGMDFKNPGAYQKAQTLLSEISEVSELSGSKGEEIIEKALDFASRIQYGDLRSQILSLLIPYLSGPKKLEFIKKALSSASSIQDETERALVISSLAPHLKGPGKYRLLEYIFDSAFYFKYGDIKFQLLYMLLPHLFGSKDERPIEKALNLVTVIYSDYQKVQAYSLIIPYLNPQRREEVLETALALASELKDKDMRPQALSFIIPYLDEACKKEILQKALELASEIKSETRKANAFSSLEPYLD